MISFKKQVCTFYSEVKALTNKQHIEQQGGELCKNLYLKLTATHHNIYHIVTPYLKITILKVIYDHSVGFV